MILADTSAWIQHFRHGESALGGYLIDGQILMHPFVIGELACGNLKRRTGILRDLNTLPRATHASDAEVLLLLDEKRLWGRGLGWIDVHLLASALLSKSALWTLDRRLASAATDIGVDRSSA